MKNFTKYLVLSLITLMLCGTLSYSQNSQGSDISDGTEFWFGLPHCKRSSDEAVRWGIYPIELWISSKVATKFTVESADGSMAKKTYSVAPLNVRVIQLPDYLENKESEIIRNKGIHIVSDDPISVGVFVAYMWSGEAYRIIPVEWLGRKYYTLNMYQDCVRMHDSNIDWKPGQILIVASRDNTRINFTPKVETANGVKAGVKSPNIILQKGDCYLIEAKIFQNLNQNWATDLSGTYIESTQPIAVLSGHTKGAFPRYSTSMYGIKADFMRNMLCDMMWPVELLGKEYVTAPIKYLNRTNYGLIPDDKGDIIRFIAAEDNTQIMIMKTDGSGMRNLSQNMKKGDRYDILSQETPGYYRSNKPVLVGQYGKSWFINIPPPIEGDNKNDDEILNPTRNGQGMMFAVAPIERWTGYATFRVPPAMDNFVYVTFRTADLTLLSFDGQLFSSKFGSAITTVPGTQYSYVAANISQGDHWISADQGAKFAGYAYGNWDQMKDGFAYGYPIGVNYADLCSDSIIVASKINCGNITGTVRAIDLNSDTICAALFSIIQKLNESYNYTLILPSIFEIGDKTTTFEIKIDNIRDTAKAVIDFMTKSGNIVRKTYTYTPELITVDLKQLDFGLMKVGDKKTLFLNISNPGTIPTTIQKLYLKYNKTTEFNIKTIVKFPFTLMPGDNLLVEIEASALVLSIQPEIDSLYATLSCYDEPIAELRFRTSDPGIHIEDAHFISTPLGDERSKLVRITNISDVDAELYSITWPDNLHFRVSGLPFANGGIDTLRILPGKYFDFTVFYKPSEINVNDKTRALFTSNASRDKLYSDWDGIGENAGPTITDYNWMKKRVIDGFEAINEIDGTVHKYPATITISDTGNVQLPVAAVKAIITNDPDNVFSVDLNSIPVNLNPNEQITVKVWFEPKAEKDYIATLTLYTEYNHNEKIAVSTLQGIGIQPHINVGDKTFPNILKNTTFNDNVIIAHINPIPGNKYSFRDSIIDLQITGIDADCFTFNPKLSMSMKINTDETVNIPIMFTAKRPGNLTANLVSTDDSPFTSIDKHVGILNGSSYFYDVITTNVDYKTIFVETTKTGIVTLTNTGDDDIQIIREILNSKINDSQGFYKIINWFTTTQKQPVTPFILKAGEVLTVELMFIPKDDKSIYLTNEFHTYDAQIEYIVQMGLDIRNLYSDITGKGMVLRTTAILTGTNNPLLPGVKSQLFDFKYKSNIYGVVTEVKQLESGVITEIWATIKFDPTNRVSGAKLLYPSFPDDKSKEIITFGTMTNGWEVISSKIDVTNCVLQVNLRTNDITNALTTTGNDVLFKYNLDVYLSDINKLEIPCDILTNQPYVYYDNIPAIFETAPVCVNNLRLIKMSGSKFNLSEITPNPVNDKAMINYEIGFEVYTTIILYNSFGDEVVTLINQVLQPGEYNMAIDVKQFDLSSGLYYYRINAGPFIDTKTINIVK